MPGLLERAQRLMADDKKRTGALLPPDDEESGVSADERRELVEQIEKLFTSRHHLAPATLKRRGGGGALPLAVNIAAVLLLLAGILTVGRIQGVAAARRASASADYLATESLVVKAVKKQAAQEVSSREARIAKIQQELDNLRRARQKTPNPAASSRERQLKSELAALRSSAGARLAALSVQRQQQGFFIRQLRGIYQNVSRDVGAGKIGAALTDLASADRLLQKERGASNAEVAAAAPALAAGNAVLRTTLLFGQSQMEATQTSAIQKKVAEIGHLVAQGNQRYKAGDLARAQALYTKALGSLASVSEAYTRLRGMTKASYDAKITDMNGKITRLQSDVGRLTKQVQSQKAALSTQKSQLAAADTRLATAHARLAAARRALGGQSAGLSAKVTRLRERIAALQQTVNGQKKELAAQNDRIAAEQRALSREQLLAQKRTNELETVVTSVRKSIARSSDVPTSRDGATNGSEVVDLLKTKVAIRALADTPEARKAQPGLYRKLTPFFQKYAATYKTQGREAALNEVASALDSVLVSLNLHLPADSAAPASAAGQLSKLDPVDGYLHQVHNLLGAAARRLD